MQGQQSTRVLDAYDTKFNEIFARNHGAEERAYYDTDPPRCADPSVGLTFYALTHSRNYGRTARKRGCE
jgi:hypothetical protein